MSAITITLNGIDNATGAIEGAAGALSGMGEIAGGVLTAGLGLASSGLGVMTDFMGNAFSAALENENAQASLAQALKGASMSIEGQAAAWEDAQGKMVTSTSASQSQIAEWGEDLLTAKAKLSDLQTKLADKTPTETQKLQLERLQTSVIDLQGNIESGGQIIQTSLVDSLGLVPPMAIPTIEKLNEMAQEFAHLAAGSDDAIVAIETIGLRAGTVAEEDFPRFIQTSLDLGTVMGSTEAAATLLARAGDDIGASIGKAEKAGILFTDQQKAEMIAMQDAGNTAGAVDLFMQQLALTTGGAAAAAAETLTGKWELMKGKFGEVAESVGMAMLPMMTTLFDTVIAPAIPIVEGLVAQFTGLVSQFASGITYLLSFATGARDIKAALEEFTMLEFIAQAFGVDLPTGFYAAEASLQPLISAVNNVMIAFTGSMPMIQASVQGMVDFVINLFNTFSPTIIANVTDTLNTIAAFWTAHGDEVMAVVSFLFNTIATVIGGTLTLVSGIISATVTLFTGVWAAGSALLEGDTDAAWSAISTMVTSLTSTIKTTISTFMNGVLSLVGTDLATFTATWQTNWDMALVIISTVWTNIQTSVTTFMTGIVTSVSSSVIGFISTWQTNWDNVKTIISTTWTNIQTGVTTSITDILNAFTSTDWLGVGTSIIQGISDGISGAVGNLVNAAVQAAMDAYNAARDALFSHSPSMLFAGLGEDTMIGMAMGIDQGSPFAIDAARQAAMDVGLAAIAVNDVMGQAAAAAFVDPFTLAMMQMEAMRNQAASVPPPAPPMLPPDGIDPFTWAMMQMAGGSGSGPSLGGGPFVNDVPGLGGGPGDLVGRGLGLAGGDKVGRGLGLVEGDLVRRGGGTQVGGGPVRRAGGGPASGAQTVTLNINISGSAKNFQIEIENAVTRALNKAGLAVNHTARMGAKLA